MESPSQHSGWWNRCLTLDAFVAALRAHGQFLAALAATRVDDLAAPLGRHARTETVGSEAARVVGLVRALHGLILEKGADECHTLAPWSTGPP